MFLSPRSTLSSLGERNVINVNGIPHSPLGSRIRDRKSTKRGSRRKTESLLDPSLRPLAGHLDNQRKTRPRILDLERQSPARLVAERVVPEGKFISCARLEPDLVLPRNEVVGEVIVLQLQTVLPAVRLLSADGPHEVSGCCGGHLVPGAQCSGLKAGIVIGRDKRSRSSGWGTGRGCLAVDRGVRDTAVGAGGVEFGLPNVVEAARDFGSELAAVASEVAVASVNVGRQSRCG